MVDCQGFQEAYFWVFKQFCHGPRNTAGQKIRFRGRKYQQINKIFFVLGCFFSSYNDLHNAPDEPSRNWEYQLICYARSQTPRPDPINKIVSEYREKIYI